MLDLVSELGDWDCDEGVNDCKQEDHRGDHQEGLLLRPEGEFGTDALNPGCGFLLRKCLHAGEEFRRLQLMAARGVGHFRHEKGEKQRD